MAWMHVHSTGLVRLSTVVTAVMGVGGHLAVARAQWSVTILHPAGATSSQGNAIAGGVGGGSGDFQQAGQATVGGDVHACIWSGASDSWIDLNPAGAVYSYAYAAAGDRQGGGARIDDVVRAGLWTGTAESWADLHPSGTVSSTVNGMDDSQQVGFAEVDGFDHAVVWRGTAASWVDLNPAGAEDSMAYGVSGGKQVGHARVNGVSHASLWSGTAESWIDLHPAGEGATFSHARGVWSGGSLEGGRQVGYVAMGNLYHASLWSGTAESWVDLNPAGATQSQAFGVFGGQQVGQVTINNVGRASLWSGGRDSWVDLHALLPPGYRSSRAQSIWSSANTLHIAGFGENELTTFDEALLWKLALPASCPADIGVQGGLPGSDGALDNDDFIVFIDGFFSAAPVADRGVTGGLLGADGLFDNNDFVVFIDQFFGGCS